ncbi:hypothetical protein [Thalassolituus hydrocarboniclasticus]|uniref:Lipoprotein n=1 Tax=Thalassolituus hydrocarboniclasticus TaxID=2742796 RepID=A0ABY6A7H5_9GAMM|nr:hypothetical protein [Thalassolituus hydrocarboniclasticus]UXD86884.1 hypothetical protein HUF19_05235 [Thalassolituus hydrocarboniclasticus]
MELKKNYLALAIVSAALVGCGGDDNKSNGSDPVAKSFVSCEGDVCTLTGTIDEDYTLTADKTWLLDGLVKVGRGNVGITAADVAGLKADGAILTVEPGTHVQGLDDGVLIVTRGSKIMAEGTAANPITFSSAADENFDGLGEWGGVIIQGFAPQYGAGNTGACYGEGTVCNVQGEGGVAVGFYGGNEPADNSGVLKYVRIAEAGKVAGPNNEVNGLTLMGVGHGTSIEYIQVHNNLDDGIEWFGGTVNVKYAVLTGNDDDDIDFDTGWKGNVQYAIVRKDATKANPSGTNDPRGIEANSSDAEFVPQTEGALANITLIGGPVSNVGGEPAMRLRGAVNVRLYNSVAMNWGTCARIDSAVTGTEAGTVPSDVSFTNVVGSCTNFYRTGSTTTEAGTVGNQSLTMTDAVALTSSSVTVSAWEPADNGSGFAFDNTNYAGAVAPGTTAANAWWAGWIIPGSLDGVATQANPAVAVAAE